jgi:hypothetical protein
LKVTDKQVALSKMERLVREAQQERYGIIPPRSLSAALTTPLAIHVREFIAELQKLGRDERYVEQRKSALSRLLTECGWKSLGEISLTFAFFCHSEGFLSVEFLLRGLRLSTHF